MKKLLFILKVNKNKFFFSNLFIQKNSSCKGEAFTKTKSITFKNLRKRIKIYQANLKKLGIKRGDRVVGYMPNCIEYVEAKLATISLGAVWSCASPDFGSQVKF
jgi:acyl-coenzyme A synthetase/AMP-(fatty) acid ligase